MTAPRVAIVVVSHSAQLAAGVAELAAQMAPDTTILAVGGDDGRLGTSFDAVAAALQRAGSAAGAVVLYDLGGARLASETAVEFLDPALAEKIDIIDAPLVEGALAAATEAQSGADRASVIAAARSAAGSGPAEQAMSQPMAGGAVRRSVTVPNRLGLHARPVAELIRQVAGLDAGIQIARPGQPPTDLRSLLAVVSLAVRGGETIGISASGPDASQAADRVSELITAGFGELDRPGSDLMAAEVASGQPAPAGSAQAGVTGERKSAGPRGAPGRAIGPAVRAAVADVGIRTGSGPEREGRRLDAALEAAVKRLSGGDQMSRAHAVLIGDPQLRDAAERGLADGLAAESAWWQAVSAVAGQFAASADELVAARAADVREGGAAVLAELGETLDRIPPPDQMRGAVLVADEVGPGEVLRVAERGGVAVVLAGGSPTAHAVLVARNLGLPMVLGAGETLEHLRPGAVLDVDGTAGSVQADPPDLARRQSEVAAQDRRRGAERELAAAPVYVGGRRIRVAANIGSVAEARVAVAAGADGVGLLRTELLVPDRPELPDEDTQVGQLTAILELMGDRPVVIRVLDLGGDKPLRAVALDPRHNGFLGVRGLRWLLRHPDVLHTQLRAICRAAAGHHVEVMAPMVTLAREAAAFCDAVDAAVASLEADGISHGRPDRVGVMIEVPAAALAADEIAALVDFVSVGTNDLIAYTMAADRTEPDVAALADPTATAIWRILEFVCAGAVRGGADVSVCGELAADERFARRLVELGVTELSMAAGRIPAVKTLLRAASSAGGRPP
ncbi:MAG: dihydroxyacetone kinase phosphoryl donor subunit DhaM [Streptosporangiaceae bacterium]|jgi:phosphocarrier protein FPr